MLAKHGRGFGPVPSIGEGGMSGSKRKTCEDRQNILHVHYCLHVVVGKME